MRPDGSNLTSLCLSTTTSEFPLTLVPMSRGGADLSLQPKPIEISNYLSASTTA